MLGYIIIIVLTLVYNNYGFREQHPSEDSCLTGTFTDVQSWAFMNGSLQPHLDKSQSLDLSENMIFELSTEMIWEHVGSINKTTNITMGDIYKKIVVRLEKFDWKNHLMTVKSLHLCDIKFLSLAQNNLKRIPLFQSWMSETSGKAWRNLQFLSLAGNDFSRSTNTKFSYQPYNVTINATDYEETDASMNAYNNQESGSWVDDLVRLDLRSLIELDLRRCKIRRLIDHMFVSMPNLRRLYLAENEITEIFPMSFEFLPNLIHLDLSRSTTKLSQTTDERSVGSNLFHPLVKLKSIDFSYSLLDSSIANALVESESNIERLSICYTKFPLLDGLLFGNKALKYLDISGNIEFENLCMEEFTGTENTLEILYANKIGIKNFTPFENLTNLRILSLTDNDIAKIDYEQIKNMNNLKILDLENNRIVPWSENTFGLLENLKILSLKRNSLSFMTQQMYDDLVNVSMISFAKNKFACNCMLSEIFRGSSGNFSENIDTSLCFTNMSEKTFGHYNDNNVINHHKAFKQYREIVPESEYNNLVAYCNVDKLLRNSDASTNSSYFIFDYTENDYLCVDMRFGKFLTPVEINECDFQEKTSQRINRTMSLLFALSIVAFAIFITVIVVWKWWYIRYFFLLMKNVAVLSIIKKDSDSTDNDKVFNYDVFVSYCDSDREWVLDHLLPHIENNSPTRVCLHERDFQVGLSILENIISCIDRSRALLMVVSNQFLMSQWCQFEMHLAQHRLLETRREHLILVLLENIPRKRRPNTLHYLMMTKTYIVWPKNNPEEEAQFWKRLKKAIAQDSTAIEKISLA